MSRREGAAKIPVALLLGLAVGLAVTLIGAVITASLIQSRSIDEDATGLAAMVIILLGAAAASLVTAGKVPQMRLVMCLGGGGIYLLGLLCCAAVLFDGVKAGVLPSLPVIAAGSLAVYLLGMKGSRKPKYKVPKLRI